MRLPKKVVICGAEWTVKTDKNEGGGSFSSARYEIVVGTKYEKDIPNIFLHEVIEAIFAERCMRYYMYKDQKNEDYLFSFDHKEFQNAIYDISLALKGILCTKRIP